MEGLVTKTIYLSCFDTTTKNFGAGVVTDTRLGVESSKADLPVRIGFNHAFSRMISAINEFLASHADAVGTVHLIGHSLDRSVSL